MTDELEILAHYSRKHVQKDIDTEELRLLMSSDFYNYFSDGIRKKIDVALSNKDREKLPPF